LRRPIADKASLRSSRAPAIRSPPGTELSWSRSTRFGFVDPPAHLVHGARLDLVELLDTRRGVDETLGHPPEVLDGIAQLAERLGEQNQLRAHPSSPGRKALDPRRGAHAATVLLGSGSG
jgi:hypothetical protein